MNSNRINQSFSRIINADYFPWVLVCLGVLLRLVRYLHDPSLWFDEANEAVNFFNQSFSGLIFPSSEDEVITNYPIGYLLLVKTSALLFGYSEYALRLIPLLSGIASMFLFYYAAKHYVKHSAVITGLALFATLDPLIFYSSTTKPYSSDIAFTLLLLLGAAHIKTMNMNALRAAFLGFVGGVIIWFSNSSVFILAGMGTVLIIGSLRKKEWSNLRGYVIISLISALSFIAYYVFYHLNVITNLDVSLKEQLIIEHAYMPFPPKSIADIRWYIDLFFEIFNNPVGFPLAISGVAALPFIIGCISMFSEKRKLFLILISPVFFTLLAAILHLYPFKDRLILFLLPVVLFIIAEGTAKIIDATRNSYRSIGVVFVAILLFFPFSWAAYHAKNPFSWEETKPVLKYIEENWQDGDIIYVYYFSQYAFQYYTEIHPDPFNFSKDSTIIGIAPRGWYRHWKKQEVSNYYDSEDKTPQSNVDILKAYVKDLQKLRGHKRVWVLFSSRIMKDGMHEEKFFLYHLDNMGSMQDFSGRPGLASAYLYDLSEDTPAKISPAL